jgi:hypothetical protein
VAVRRAPARVGGLRRYVREIILDAMEAPCQGLSLLADALSVLCGDFGDAGAVGRGLG